jgi:hypothetical protein
MPTLRRLYVYLLSAISLSMLVTGLVLLMGALYEQMGLGGQIAFGGSEGVRQQLSVAAALIGVGLPVWLIHWWFAERGLNPERPGAEAERTSAVRALYLTAVLAGSLTAGALAASSLIAAIARGAFGVTNDEFGGTDLSIQLATLLVTAVAWAYHVWIQRRDMAQGPVEREASWLPRLYLYGAALIGLLVGVQALAGLVTLAGEAIWRSSSVIGEESTFQLTRVANELGALIVGGGVWAAHWWYGLRLAYGDSWRSPGEAASRLRLAYFVVVLIVATAALVDRLAQGVRAVIAGAIGAADSLGATGGDLAREVSVALVVSALWAITWWLHARWMRAEARTEAEPGRAAMADRLEWSAPALVGLAYGAVGLGWLLGVVIDVGFGGNRTVGGTDFWRVELAAFLAMTILGGALWLAAWWRMTARQVADPRGEAVSTVRRVALILPLAGAVIAGLVSLAIVLYRFFGTIFGVTFSQNAISDLSTPLGALLVAILVAGYHGLLLRNDLRLKAASEPETVAAGTAAPPAPAPPAVAPPAEQLAGAVVVSGPTDATSVLLEALDTVAPLLTAPELREHWNDPSALVDWSVAGLAGHLARAPRVLLDYLEAPDPQGPPIDGLAYHDAVLPESFDASDPVHVGIRTRGEEFASGGPEALMANFTEAHAALAARLPSEPPERLLRVVNGIVIRLDDYLRTRLVELVVHADDLAISIGVPPPTLSPTLTDEVITHLVAVARRRHGDPAVIRALTRRERDSVEALRIF